jgi:hypothetical protein
LPGRPGPAREAIEEAASSIWRSRRAFTAGKQRPTATRLGMTDVDILLAAVRAQTRVLKLPTVGRDCDPLARQALAEAWPPLRYLRSLLDAELAT